MTISAEDLRRDVDAAFRLPKLQFILYAAFVQNGCWCSGDEFLDNMINNQHSDECIAKRCLARMGLL